MWQNLCVIKKKSLWIEIIDEKHVCVIVLKRETSMSENIKTCCCEIRHFQAEFICKEQFRHIKSHVGLFVSFSDGLFASGSHAGELILWDAVVWNILAYEHILWEESQACAQAEIRLSAPKPSEMSIQHLTTNGRVRRTSVSPEEWFVRCFDCDP